MLEVVVRETSEVKIDEFRTQKIIKEEVVWSFTDLLTFEQVVKEVKARIIQWTCFMAMN